MDQPVKDYLNKQQPLEKNICLALRKILLTTRPKIKEEMKWGVIGYDNGKYFIAVVKHGVNFGFSIKGLTRNDIEKFEGSGKTMRNIKFESIEDIDEKRLVDLIKLVHTKAKAVST